MNTKKSTLLAFVFSLLICSSSLPSYSQTDNAYQVILKQINSESDDLKAELWFQGADTLGGIELAVEIDSTNPSVIQFDFNAQDGALPDMNYLYAWQSRESREKITGGLSWRCRTGWRMTAFTIWTILRRRKRENWANSISGKNPDWKSET